MGMSSLVVVLGLIAEVYTIDVKIQALYRKKFGIARISGLINANRANAARNGDNGFTAVQLLDFSNVSRGGDVKFSDQRMKMPTVEEIYDQMKAGKIKPVYTEAAFTRYAQAAKDAAGKLAGDIKPDAVKPPGAGGVAGGGVSAKQVEEAKKEYDDLKEHKGEVDGKPVTFKGDDAKFRWLAERAHHFVESQVIDPSNMAKGFFFLRGPSGEPIAPGKEAPAEKGSTMPLEPGKVWLSKKDAEALCDSYLNEIKAMEIEIDHELEILKAQRTAIVQQREEFTKYAADAIKTGFKNNYA